MVVDMVVVTGAGGVSVVPSVFLFEGSVEVRILFSSIMVPRLLLLVVLKFSSSVRITFITSSTNSSNPSSVEFSCCRFRYLALVADMRMITNSFGILMNIVNIMYALSK